jgi:hypothetical protein
MSLARSIWVVPALAALACGQGLPSSRSPLADQWLVRAKSSYKSGDFDDARTAAESALRASPSDPEIRTVAARMALVRLDFATALKLTEGLQSSEAHGIRGRAHWYLGQLEQAADELEAALADPELKDPWAHDISRLARKGAGKKPFSMEGSVVAAVEMPQAGNALVVPCELEGERILAMIATSSAEVVLDSNSRKDPAWVDFRFGDDQRGAAIEIRDVPALVRDLSPLSRQLGAPVKALIGVNLLRRAHTTFDRRGDQFVVRLQDPPAPPAAGRVPLWYVRGGGMLMRAQVARREDARTTLFVDSAQAYPLALEDSVWKKAGVDPASLTPDPQMPKLKAGFVPQLTIGTFDLPKVPAYLFGPTITDSIPPLDVDLGGVLGAGLLSVFRVTFGDEGRFAWLEPDPTLLDDPSTISTGGNKPIPAPTTPAPSNNTPATGGKP